MYMEATGFDPKRKAHLMSPIIPLYGLVKCLSFLYNIYGAHPSTLRVLDENFDPIKTIRGGKISTKKVTYLILLFLHKKCKFLHTIT